MNADNVKAASPRAPEGGRGVLDARELAAALTVAVLAEGHTLDQALAGAGAAPRFRRLADRDRAFARLLAATVLRRAGEIEAVLARSLAKPLPSRAHRLRGILYVGAAQLLFLGTPAYAAVDSAVQQCRGHPSTQRFDKLVNAVLRRVAKEGSDILASLDGVRLNIPDWLFMRWQKTYGAELARRIGEASLNQAPLDLTVKSDAPAWADRLGGVLLPTGTVRLAAHGRVEALQGYDQGQWWVQDAAAALPAKLLGDMRGKMVADLCAAPGGKTAQLAAADAHVTAVDVSPDRLGRVRDNLARLGLQATLVEADATAWTPEQKFDAVLLDAPCTATGTIRRHPDIPHLRRPSDIKQLAAIQERLLDAAARLVSPGGLLVYCACSLEPEEGLGQIRRFLGANPAFMRAPISPSEIGGQTDWMTSDGDVRTLPCHLPMEQPALSGLDGFYAARLRRAE